MQEHIYSSDQQLFRSLRKSPIKPLGDLFISRPFEGGLHGEGRLIWEGEGDLFKLEKTMVLVLYKEIENKVEKLKYKKVGGHAAKDQNQIRTSSW